LFLIVIDSLLLQLHLVKNMVEILKSESGTKENLKCENLTRRKFSIGIKKFIKS
jgi:hypothetical protein